MSGVNKLDPCFSVTGSQLGSRRVDRSRLQIEGQDSSRRTDTLREKERVETIAGCCVNGEGSVKEMPLDLTMGVARETISGSRQPHWFGSGGRSAP